MPEHTDEQFGGIADQPAQEQPPRAHDDPEPPRSALDELRKYPFFFSDADDSDNAAPGAIQAPASPREATSDPAQPGGWSAQSAPIPAPPPLSQPGPPQDPMSTPSHRPLGWRGWAFGRTTRLVPLLLCCAIFAAAVLVIGTIHARRAEQNTLPRPTSPIVVAGNVAPSAQPPSGQAAAIRSPGTAAAVTPTSAIAATVAPARGTPPPAAATPGPSPSLAHDSPGALRQRAIALQDALQAVQLDATIDYGGGNTSTGRVRFERGDNQRASRFAIVNSYSGVTGSRTSEFLQIGAQAWQRVPGEPWQPVASPGGILEQLGAYLFPIGMAENLTIGEQDADTVTLRWFDPEHNADVALQIDRATSSPRQWHQVLRSTGQVVTVHYSSWNAPVDIPARPQP